jgi:hypothetical protein
MDAGGPLPETAVEKLLDGFSQEDKSLFAAMFT